VKAELPPRLFRGDFQHQYPRRVLACRQRGASRGIAGPDDDHVEVSPTNAFHGLVLS
jgi:hypothetical protein